MYMCIYIYIYIRSIRVHDDRHAIRVRICEYMESSASMYTCILVYSISIRVYEYMPQTRDDRHGATAAARLARLAFRKRRRFARLARFAVRKFLGKLQTVWFAVILHKANATLRMNNTPTSTTAAAAATTTTTHHHHHHHHYHHHTTTTTTTTTTHNDDDDDDDNNNEHDHDNDNKQQ